jgi:hypothetical protein
LQETESIISRSCRLRDTYLTGNPHGWLIFGLFRAD